MHFSLSLSVPGAQDTREYFLVVGLEYVDDVARRPIVLNGLGLRLSVSLKKLAEEKKTKGRKIMRENLYRAGRDGFSLGRDGFSLGRAGTRLLLVGAILEHGWGDGERQMSQEQNAEAVSDAQSCRGLSSVRG